MLLRIAWVSGGNGAYVTPRTGRMVSFSAGIENLHGVTAVTRGQRCALSIWLTEDFQKAGHLKELETARKLLVRHVADEKDEDEREEEDEDEDEYDLPSELLEENDLTLAPGSSGELGISKKKPGIIKSMMSSFMKDGWR